MWFYFVVDDIINDEMFTKIKVAAEDAGFYFKRSVTQPCYLIRVCTLRDLKDLYNICRRFFQTTEFRIYWDQGDEYLTLYMEV